MVRLTCSQCQRPAGLCYCDSIRPVTNTTEVSIIQHPLEQQHPFNTGRIAHLALSKCNLIVAEQLNANDCQQVITESSVLLYPDLDWLTPA
ncbi:MAG: DTW domain-containing protein, partial [Gammaproteobacteria bacterium]|nr:DTW domain-containing protein [Gammaproteobacteria bacterium]